MEPTTTEFVNQYLGAGGAPFNIMNLLVFSYEGLAAMSNMVHHDMASAFDNSEKSAILDTISRKIVESFDAKKADAEYNETQQLPKYIDEMIPHSVWRRTIYRLNEMHPKSVMLGAALQRIADNGYQAEMTSLNSTSLHAHVFYPLLVECFEKITPADDENIQAHLSELTNSVCRGEKTYIVAQYVLQNVRRKLGNKATATIQRIEQELESYMLDNYDLPQLAIHIKLLLSGRAVGGDDAVANAVAGIIQSTHATPGDVMVLYKQYYNTFAKGQQVPPVELLRDERVLLPMMDQAFSHIWSSTPINTRNDLMGKYLWLIAYATLFEDNEQSDSTKREALGQLVSQMKELREEIPIHPNQANFNKIIGKVINWIDVPVLARIVVLWIRDMLSYDGFSYYETYFHSSEVPTPLLLLEEIAYRHPLLKPLVFSVYKDSFESKVQGFLPDKQIRLQKVVINRIAALVQMDYASPVLQYFSQQVDAVDETVTVYFIYRTLVQFEPPYTEEFYMPMLQLTERVMDSVKIAREKELTPIREFLQNIDHALAKKQFSLLPAPSAS
ncbi:hypothetical protein IW140_000288 [Coemansia sp. RSA 1813]|nr:hypothetical protein EV178_000489 [Coemansia sp. RSA 1646]KAJ1773741.1 hypothetical protein LPJ74_000284 [Coemansia sp. RSA 1843]KAJ2093702.1 hypothetical protein IW138_000097 [Coemansia sp. RSA 986]KAJ2217917.1 hypothetical protein EV179_000061 [Coemansia sp. RSA 487]KAJ2573244.1 hypothetical protein IW140_000288 [Coemansia sp. RSA 1813]